MTGRNILIVDDDRDFAHTVADVLRLHQHRVEVVFSGEEAVRKFRDNHYDLAFMDVKLPGRNGVESFLEIRRIRPDARVVMMTGYSVEQLLDQALAKGAWAVLHKPLDMQRVLEIIENLAPPGVILIADDDPDFAESIRSLLEAHGYRSVVAGNGKEALEFIRQDGVQLLILDLRMPIMDGLSVYLDLKQNGRLPPTIVVTAYYREEKENLDVLCSAAMTGVLTKPVDPRHLLECVHRFLVKPGYPPPGDDNA